MITARTTPSAGSDDGPCFAYLLLSHKDPGQVEALAARILELSPHGHVVVHHDLASDDVPWDGRPPSRVHFVDRSRILWGDWSIVEATLRMVRYAVEELRADWFVVLSGEHWPVADLHEWENATSLSSIDAFVEADPVPERLRFGRARRGRQHVPVPMCPLLAEREAAQGGRRPPCDRWALEDQPLSQSDHLSGVLAPPRSLVLRPAQNEGTPAGLDVLQGFAVDCIQPPVRGSHPPHGPSGHSVVPPRAHSRRDLFPHRAAPRRRSRRRQ